MPARRGAKPVKPAGKSKAKGGGGGGAAGRRREIGGLEIRANRDSLRIERHNNLGAYFEDQGVNVTQRHRVCSMEMSRSNGDLNECLRILHPTNHDGNAVRTT